MSHFFHDPTLDDQGDTFVIHTDDGLTLELCPTCLTVRDHPERGARALARVPLNLDRIDGVAAGAEVTAHATHAHLLTVTRSPGGLDVQVTTPHYELLRRHLPLPGPNGHEPEAEVGENVLSRAGRPR